MLALRLILLLVAMLWCAPGHAETKDEWIALGARIHGAFGALIPVGIRIGLDAVERLKPEPRGLSVVYYSGAKAPCPCVADGIMLATHTSPGQGTLQIASEPAPSGMAAVIAIKNRKTGEGIRYTVPDDQLVRILGWLKLEPSTRYDAVMGAGGLFTVEPIVEADK
jgi:formylmethanofuran dehydrogenase subunit E